ncbi:hypothetical protein P153DRAFT_354233 [Dothidotthia symphoricarpi CBS 119687]|uniref:Uncharacterized protein n=1 Tax=Dothidotthia symphoricarpi CBS 119687 TaxID=1392245 RepID=A0A6A6AMH1_9PLEO|nr:uncharacterized protein P153DRAFT_354233 [Dothidotthia symphoricarpi CBS 119687]KAF2132766.1 hypothetical protein P153DRAFT_354233 [Dothidotthia symphoricarpi CBS 119687]
MSDKVDTGSAGGSTSNGAAPQFTERELQLLGWAMQSLKSGPPEIDYEKLAKFASMSNPRSASNAWAKIKSKLMTSSDGTVAATPKKGGAKRKAEDGGEGTPKKTPRKRAAKKQDVDGAGDASPKKKGRAAAKKVSDDEADNVKTESDDSADTKSAVTAKEEPIEDEV